MNALHREARAREEKGHGSARATRFSEVFPSQGAPRPSMSETVDAFWAWLWGNRDG